MSALKAKKKRSYRPAVGAEALLSHYLNPRRRRFYADDDEKNDLVQDFQAAWAHANLSRHERQVIVNVFVRDLGVDETAKALSVEIGVVEACIRRATKKIVAHMTNT